MQESEWKIRATNRGLENKMLKKKCKELTVSRDSWKGKSIKRKADLDALNKQFLAVKKNILKIVNF